MVTLVLLPGMDGTGDLFAPLVAALSPSQSVIVVRYPLDGTQGYAELEAVARAALPVDRPFVLLGESFSGPIVISLAASQPPQLRGLVLCCTFARNPFSLFARLKSLTRFLPLKVVPQIFVEWFLLSRFATASLRAAFRTALKQVSQSTLQARLRALLAVDVSTKLASVAAEIREIGTFTFPEFWGA